jgi:ABC-2 type transport system permease protein
MFFQILKFELKYWLRQPMIYVFLFVNFLLIFGATCSDQITVGGSVGNVLRNAPFSVQSFYSIMSLLGMLMTTAFVQNAALRDFNYNTHQIVFSSPILKPAYLFGRFTGSFLVACLPFFGVMLGSVLGGVFAPMFDWIPAERFGATPWQAHLDSFLIFILPNTLFVGAVVFAIAALTRSTMLSFIGTIVLLVLYIAAGNFMQDAATENRAVFMDAFGVRPFSIATKYWTMSEKNTQSVGLSNPDLLLNRLIWIGVSVLTLVFTYFRFSFSEKLPFRFFKKKKKNDAKNTPIPASISGLLGTASVVLPRVSQSKNGQFVQFWSETKANFWFIVKSTAFIVLLLAGVLNMWGSLHSVGRFYGTTVLPTTYNVIDAIRGSMYMFLISIVVFYSGSLVWRERDVKMDQIHDTMPHHSAVSFLSKLAAMVGVVFIIQVLAIGLGVFTQTLKGFHDYKMGVYVTDLLVFDLLGMTTLVVLSMFFQTIINNKYIAFFAFIAFLAVNAFLWRGLNVSSNLVNYGSVPSHTFSDMNGFGPFLKTMLWHYAYWLLAAGLLSVATILFWLRGTDAAWASRRKNAAQIFVGKTRLAGIGLLVAFVGLGSFVVWNTKFLNHYSSKKERQNDAFDYETKYKKYENQPIPTITDIKYDIEIFPKERNLIARGTFILKNKTANPLEELHFTASPDFNCELKIDRAVSTFFDKKLGYQIFKITPALAVGDSVKLTFESKRLTKGFENEVSFTKIVENGSFFDISDFCPFQGYQRDVEISDKNDRKKYGLPERPRVAKLVRGTSPASMKSYVAGSDWVNVETTISTSADQIAIAPGSLVREWSENGRRFFNYKVDHKSLNFSAFMSGRYEVAREKWNGIDVEVYYDKQHARNVPNMVNSIKKSLAYYSENFGKYQHNQARIIEFPRYASFAQAFPGTMPYSEEIGFVADLDPETDIDMVFYVVAHEMGHQWWAHQVVGAEMQGATLLSESMAQYSALMVMEKEFGRERMTKFLKYETDRYLRQRSGEGEKEVPIFKVENQGYIHYQKGSAVMFHLKEAIGEKSVNAALREMVEKFGYKDPPYPNSYDLLDLLRKNTPDSLQSLVTDLFEDIVLFDNRTTKATSKPLADGKFEVEIEVSTAKIRADSSGLETPLPLNDWMDIGVFAKPEGEKEVGKLLSIRREKMTKPTAKFKFIVDEKPFEAGIDPLRYLIDRMPKDNLKTVSEEK